MGLAYQRWVKVRTCLIYQENWPGRGEWKQSEKPLSMLLSSLLQQEGQTVGGVPSTGLRGLMRERKSNRVEAGRVLLQSQSALEVSGGSGGLV